MARPKGPIRKKNCKVCGKEFTCKYREGIGVWNKKKCCSSECAAKSQITKVKKECLVCNKEFKVTRNRTETAKYCSKKCKSEADKLRVGNKNPHFNRIEKHCCICNKKILVIPARLKRQKCCSMACYSELKKQMSPTVETRKKISQAHKRSGQRPPTMIGEDHPMWKGGKPKCLVCGAVTKDYHSKVCRGCQYRYYSGSKSPRWKGGKTSEDRLQRVKFQKETQKKVFERDDYTCQICGLKGIDLQVDHIQSWSEYVELRFCLDNCRTLCASCHYKITFGKPMPPTVRAWGHNLLKGENKL